MTKAKFKNPASVFIDVREWRDKMYGNTYYSAIVSVDGKWIYTTGMTYGYGDQAEYDVVKWLEANGIVKLGEDHMAATYRFREAGITLYTAHRDVLKRELPKKMTRDEIN